jgi:hypothetical protein
MANHDNACANSKQLCELLFCELNKKIGNLVYKNGPNKCSIRSTGKIFVWVNSHHQIIKHLNVWFLGDADKAEKFTGLNIRPRRNLEKAGGWREWGGSFDIDSEKQLAEAVELLFAISYPESLL